MYDSVTPLSHIFCLNKSLFKLVHFIEGISVVYVKFRSSSKPVLFFLALTISYLVLFHFNLNTDVSILLVDDLSSENFCQELENKRTSSPSPVIFHSS